MSQQRGIAFRAPADWLTYQALHSIHQLAESFVPSNGAWRGLPADDFDTVMRTMQDTQYFKRYRMEIRLDEAPLPAPELPSGYTFIGWNPADVERHALIKFRSFRDEMDAEVFSCLGEYYGCLRLMSEIAHQLHFLAEATWMIGWTGPSGANDDCGTIQGIILSEEIGSIQNVGVVPEHRGQGLGRALVLKSLAGFQQARMRQVILEVTANNITAVKLYQSLGFQITRTMYRRSNIEVDQP